MKAHAHAEVVGTTAAWLSPLHDWPRAAAQSVRRDGAVVRVVVASVLGSAPRDVGTCMLVERSRILGTIGGGHLEWAAIQTARGLLEESGAVPVRVDRLVLGTQLQQCCGGVVEVLIERYTRADLALLATLERATRDQQAVYGMTILGSRVERHVLRNGADRPRLVRAGEELQWREPLATQRPNIWLYGAGHVGQALVRVLAELPVSVCWIDSRADLLPHQIADSIRVLHTNDPVATVTSAPRDACFVVMTHSHPLDYELCRAILTRGDQRWVGVIGSQSKGARFRSRLAREGVASADIERLVCPIGITGVQSKEPGAIAIAVAAQLLALCDAHSVAWGGSVQPAPGACGRADAAGSCSGCDRHEGTPS